MDNRPLRQKKSDSRRLSALEQLRAARTGDADITFEEDEPGYEYVDDEQYSKIVLERQNFIVGGLFDDGRELFEKTDSQPKKRKKDIRSLLHVSKPKVTTPKLDNDDVLSDIMKELNQYKPKEEKFTMNEGKFQSTLKFCDKFKQKPILENKNYFSPLKLDIDVPEFTFPESDDLMDVVEEITELKPPPKVVEEISEFKPPPKVVEETHVEPLIPIGANKTDKLLFYWLDAYDEFVGKSGVIYLFGKAHVGGELVSATLQVEKIPRVVYIIGDKFDDYLLEETKALTAKFGIKDANLEKSDRTHVDNSRIGLRLTYSSIMPALPFGHEGTHIRDIVGTSPLENFLLETKIKGPCWLNISKAVPSKSAISWTKSEFIVSDPSSITLAEGDFPSPSTTLLYLRLSVKDSVLTGVAGLINRSYPLDKSPNRLFEDHFCITVGGKKGHKIDSVPNERALLGLLLGKMHKIDPDILVTHSAIGYGLEVLIERLKKNKVAHWSKLGRLRRVVIPKMLGNWRDFRVVCGRMLCDLNLSVRDLLNLRSYEMSEIVKHVLNEEYSLSSDVDSVLGGCRQGLQVMDELKIIPLCCQITHICGNVMAHTLLSGRSERNEFLLLHAFHKAGFLPITGQASVRHDKKPGYSGGLVLDPKIGFYDTLVVLMDFNSLYPSIIQEFNVCFSTKTGPDQFGSHPGILPAEIRKLVESRREIKRLMKEEHRPDLKQQYNIRQQALKLTANSLYGCLGFSNNRFYAKDLAAFITAQGRMLLSKSKDLVESMGLEVVYGDTDSLMINTNCRDLPQAMGVANRVKQSVNKLYKHLEIELDGVFRSLLLLKKKKYAALQLNSDGSVDKVTKGIDSVRRDWCPLAKVTGNHVVELILSGSTRETVIGEIHSLLSSVADSVRRGETKLSDFIITKQLAKNPGNYGSSLPHVSVALRLNQHGWVLKSGDAVEYVVCDDGTSRPATQRVYHPSEVDEAKPIDVDYYLSHQLLPVVSRLCVPIDGTSPAQIAQSLGIESPSVPQLPRFHQTPTDCKPLCWDCPHCATTIRLDSPPIASGSNGLWVVLSSCANAECPHPPISYIPFIENQLVITARKFISQYYEGWMICDDCYHRTRLGGLTIKQGSIKCPQCNKGGLVEEYSASQLYRQISYFRTLFDIDAALKGLSASQRHSGGLAGQISQCERGYYRLMSRVDNILSYSAYSNVDLSLLFVNLFKM